MKIRTVTESTNSIESIKNDDFLSEVSKIIFAICKDNTLFKTSNKPLDAVEGKISTMDMKISKQETGRVSATISLPGWITIR